MGLLVFFYTYDSIAKRYRSNHPPLPVAYTTARLILQCYKPVQYKLERISKERV